MKVKITQVHGGGIEHFSGSPEEVQAQLRVAYPWLEEYGNEGVLQDVAQLQRTESLGVEVEA